MTLNKSMVVDIVDTGQVTNGSQFNLLLYKTHKLLLVSKYVDDTEGVLVIHVGAVSGEGKLDQSYKLKL